MAKRADEIREDDLAGMIKLVFLDNRHLYEIVPEHCVSTNAFYRLEEDKQEGRPILPWEEYTKEARKRFLEIGVTIVSQERYNEFKNEHICGRCFRVLNYSDGQSGLIKALCFETHDISPDPHLAFANC